MENGENIVKLVLLVEQKQMEWDYSDFDTMLSHMITTVDHIGRLGAEEKLL